MFEQPEKRPRKKRVKHRIALVSTHGYVAATPPLGAPDTGGQVVYVLELAKKFAQFGFNVDIWTRQFEDQPQMEEVEDKVRIIRMPCGGPDFIPKEYLIRHISEWVQKALEFIRKKKLNYDFINSHYWDAGVAGQGLSEQLDIPHIHTPHSIGAWKKEMMQTDFPDDDMEEMEKKYNFKQRIRKELEVYQSCDLVIATTPIQYDKIKKDYDLNEKKLRMVPPGYDDNRFFTVGEPSRQAIREHLNFRGRVVFAVARLAENKGFDLLVDAFKLTAERLEDSHLVLAIGHEDRNEQEEAIYQDLVRRRKKYGLEDRIHFIGFIEDEDLPDYYRAADTFVLCSRYEPFGMTAVEAIASGTPTVVTIHGGLFRILEYGVQALFADPFDAEDLGITITKSLKYGSLRRRLRDQGARYARSLFTWTGVTQQILNALGSSVSGTGAGVTVRPNDEL